MDIPDSFMQCQEEVHLIITSNGTKEWRNNNGELHREKDLPAVEFPIGIKNGGYMVNAIVMEIYPLLYGLMELKNGG